MTAFLFRLETADGAPAEPPRLRSAVSNWRAGDTIPLGHRTLHVVQVRDDDADEPPVLVVVFPTQSDSVWVRNRTAARITYELPRGLANDFSDEDRAGALATQEAANQRADEVVEALRLFKRGRVSVTGKIAPHDGGVVFFGGGHAVPQVAEPDLVLTAAEAESFRRFWPLFRAARQIPAVEAAIRRFSYAGERTRPDDEIVDLVAALEGLLLSGISEAGEFAYRTSLRGALFIGGTGLTRRQVRKQLGRGYAVRSAVAHGAEPRKSDLKNPNGESADLAEFVDGIEDLVRSALHQAVEAVGGGATWPPDWEALTLEGGSYPP